MPIARESDASWWGGSEGRPRGLFVAGWGYIADANVARGFDFGDTPDVARTAEVSTIPASSCIGPGHPVSIAQRYLCVPARRSDTGAVASACYGDRGGPLVASDPVDGATRKLVGVVSHGVGTTVECLSGPGAFTPVAPFATWIDEVVAGRVAPSDRAATARAVAGSKVQLHVDGPDAATSQHEILMRFDREFRSVGVFSGVAATRALPPSTTGTIRLAIRSRYPSGETSSSIVAAGQVRTRVDRQAPAAPAWARARRHAASYFISWARARDDDRAAGYLIQYRRRGQNMWRNVTYLDCDACWAGSHGAASLRYTALFQHPGSSFRVSAMDRAGNWGPWTNAR
jgi:hypothetical protein